MVDVEAAARAQRTRRLRVRRWPTIDRDAGVVGVVVGWITLVLVVDSAVNVWGQLLLGLATWGVLIALLRHETPLTRAQVSVVIVFATLIEYAFSPLLEVYTYRLGGILGVPSFVPPGHGLVYLAALALGRSAWAHRHSRPLIGLTVVAAGAYAAWGLWWSPQPDSLGAFWYLCLLGFLKWGRMPLLYVGAFVVVTYLEILGTALGVWVWAPLDPTGLVTIGNPPSVAAGGYGWFDLAAVLLAPSLLLAVERVRRLTHRGPATSRRADADELNS